jgi:hypothetical protein
MKICKGCNLEKDIGDFQKNKARKDGVQTYCQKCTIERNNSNREELNAQSKKYYLANRDERRAKSYGHARKNKSRFKRGIIAAKDRGYSWHITLDEWISIVEDDSCHYCKGRLPETGHGLDRKDNSKDYYADNVVPCCSTCNLIKNNSISYIEMIAITNLLIEMRKSNR